MKVNRLQIKESGVLKNINIPCTQVNLIIGDNERGKTTLLNWIAKGLFDKNQESENFESLSPYYDGERMQNLLFIKERDLVFKYKNQEELHKQEFWNNAVHTLLYGNDDISPILQNNFLRSMGVKNKNSWLVTLHEKLFNLKNVIEDSLPELENIHGKTQGLYNLNNSLNNIQQAENISLSKEELYFYLDKIQIGEKYLSFCKQHQQIQNYETEIQDLLYLKDQLNLSLVQKDDELFDLEDDIDNLNIEFKQSKQKELQVLSSPYDVYGQDLHKLIYKACAGVAMLLISLTLAFQSMTEVGLSLVKMSAVVCFVIGGFCLAKAVVHSYSLQQLAQSSEEDPNYIHKNLIKKVQDKTIDISNKLGQKQLLASQISDDINQMRKDLKTTLIKLDSCKNDVRDIDLFMKEFENSKRNILDYYESNNTDFIAQDIQGIKHFIAETCGVDYETLQHQRHEKQIILKQQSDISGKVNSSRGHIAKDIKSLIDDLHNIDNQKMIQHFYPELYTLNTNDIANYSEVLNVIDSLINKVGNDRYRAEKLVSIFNQVENNSETLLSKTLESPFFGYLTQNIFGGKYHRFVTQNTPEDGFKIFAETHKGELFPIDSLSTGTYAQFWFMLRLGIAKSILKNQPGILLLDDPFTSFDTIRKQYFLDAINALVHQGWQIFITITDDHIIHDYFKSVFQPELTIIDLNKDYE